MLELDNNLLRTQCPLCSSSNIRKIGNISFPKPISFSSYEVRLKHIPELYYCQSCRSRFVSKIIKEETLKKIYRSGKSNEKWKPFRFEEDKLPDMIQVMSELLCPNKYVLDIGCNTGDFLDFARRRGCITHGVEYSISCHKILTDKGHEVFASENDVYRIYDIITAFDVIEHVYDVNVFLESYSSKLKKDGYFVLLTGDISCVSALVCKENWWYVTLPEHIIFPSKKFFEFQERLILKKCISLYHSKFFRVPWISRFKLILSKLMKGKQYTGFPSLSADHILVVLQKR